MSTVICIFLQIKAHPMTDHHHKKKQFLNLPKYPGGNPAFKEFIASNLKYPVEALEAGVEGAVMIEYDINDNGLVEHPRVLKGIGHGCDEEAMRVVGLLRYEKVKNRGLRVKMTTKATIHFNLPAGTRISYTTAKKEPPDKKTAQGKSDDKPATYEYTITF
jgi:TonB family protein